MIISTKFRIEINIMIILLIFNRLNKRFKLLILKLKIFYNRIFKFDTLDTSKDLNLLLF
jgi:hypothetical protein